MSENQIHQRCPLCLQTADSVLRMPDRIYGKRYAILRCRSCRTSFTDPFPSEDELNRIYSGEYWAKETTLGKKGRLGRAVTKFNLVRMALLIRPLLKTLPPGASVLEVGCGSGHLAAYIKRCGFEVEITDISRDILEEVRAVHNISGYCGNLEEIEFGHQYDAIVFNNVLEHLRSPNRAISTAAKLLKPDGRIFVEVPNIDSYQFKLLGARWYHLAIPQHLYHFSPESLDRIMSTNAMNKIWASTYSPRTSAAGYAASLIPSLQPAKLRQAWSTPKLLIYLILQIAALPLVCAESLMKRGATIRCIYQKKSE